jgi:hypothetical protein
MSSGDKRKYGGKWKPIGRSIYEDL